MVDVEDSQDHDEVRFRVQGSGFRVQGLGFGIGV